MILPVEPPVLEAVAAIEAGRPVGFPVGGIDVSSHDHRRFGIHWPTEVAAGSEFVYIKATEGTTYVNPHFAADYTAARRAGRYVGAYVYARPDRGDPVARPSTSCGTPASPATRGRWCRSSTWSGPYAGVRTDDCYDLTRPSCAPGSARLSAASRPASAASR